MTCACKLRYKAAKVYETWLLSSLEEQSFSLTGHLPDCSQAPRDAKVVKGPSCLCKTEEGVQITWCAKHNGWEYARQMDALRQKAEEENVLLLEAGKELGREIAELRARLFRADLSKI